MLNPLPDLGSRVAKYWFMVTPNRPRGQSSGNTSQMILMLAPVAKQCPIALHRENLNTANELLAALKVNHVFKSCHVIGVQNPPSCPPACLPACPPGQHPYLQSVEHLDYLPQQSSVVMVMTFFPRGSLKDIIYKVRTESFYFFNFNSFNSAVASVNRRTSGQISTLCGGAGCRRRWSPYMVGRSWKPYECYTGRDFPLSETCKVEIFLWTGKFAG